MTGTGSTMRRGAPHGQVVVDVGKSGTRLAVTDKRGARVVESAVGVSPAQGGELGGLIAREIVALLDRADASSFVATVAIGSTAELVESERRVLVERLAHRLDSAVIALTDDGTLAHALHLDGPGVLLSVGTGVVTIGRSVEGELVKVDGWGPLLGDRGGASEVGLHALRHALELIDRGHRDDLVAASERIFGKLDVHFARRLTADPTWPSLAASFAREVVGLARGGDATARALVDDAARSLTASAVAGSHRSGTSKVVVTGRFGRLDPLGALLDQSLAAAGLDVGARLRGLAELDVPAFIDSAYPKHLASTR